MRKQTLIILETVRVFPLGITLVRSFKEFFFVSPFFFFNAYDLNSTEVNAVNLIKQSTKVVIYRCDQTSIYSFGT